VTIIDAARRTPHAARRTPHAARRTPHAARRTPHAARRRRACRHHDQARRGFRHWMSINIYRIKHGADPGRSMPDVHRHLSK